MFPLHHIELPHLTPHTTTYCGQDLTLCADSNAKVVPELLSGSYRLDLQALYVYKTQGRAHPSMYVKTESMNR